MSPIKIWLNLLAVCLLTSLSTPHAFANYSEARPHLYFGYGSNLSYAFFKERLKDGEWIADYQKSGQLQGAVPEDLGVYVLDDYEFGYTLNVEPFGDRGTAGNVVPKAGSKVYGILYRICDAHLVELDKTEDVNEAYFRVALNVHKLTKDTLDSTENTEHPDNAETNEAGDAEEIAWVYVGNPKYVVDQINPDPAYVELLVNAAIDRHIPRDYIECFLQIFFALQLEPN